MKRFWMLSGAILLVLLLVFLIAEQFGLSAVFELQYWMQPPSLAMALLGVGLLAADVLLPVPSSLIMIANGAMFGLGLGTLLSLIGSTLAALLGFWLGRTNRALVARLVSSAQMQQADQLLARWGMLAIIVTRPIPLLAETITIVAGTSRLTYAQLLVATVAGALPIAGLYALTGSMAAGFDSTIWSFALVMLVAGLFWLLRDPLNQLLIKVGGDRSLPIGKEH